MAFIQCDFFSRVLNLSTSMNVILPRMEEMEKVEKVEKMGKMEGPQVPYRTLYLLHGFSQDHTSWCRQTSIERYAEAHGLAVVMPNGHHSFYLDMAQGPAYGAFMEEEIPAVTRSLFPLSHRREDTFVAGLSMGGYGAFRLALARPDLFSAAGSISGAVDIALLTADANPDWRAECERIFGRLDRLPGSSADLFSLASRLPDDQKRKLRFYQCCGTEDVLYQGNLRFRDHARGLGLDLEYTEGPGDHEWGYWDRMVKELLDWLPGGGKPKADFR